MKLLTVFLNLFILAVVGYAQPSSQTKYSNAQKAVDLTQQAIKWSNEKKMTQALQVFTEVVAIRRQLAEANPVDYQPLLAISLDNLGFCYFTMGQFEKALDAYSEAMNSMTLGLNSMRRGNYSLGAWSNVFFNVANLQETCAETKDTALLLATSSLLATNCTVMRWLDNKLTLQAVYQYGNLTWYSVLTKRFVDAENAARRALAIDKTQTFVKVALAHSLLLQDKYSEAEQFYLELKPLRNLESNRPYRDIFLEDFKTLERKGIVHKDIKRIIQLLK